MPRGGRRANSGRKKGGKNRRTVEIEQAVATAGVSPLSYLLGVLNSNAAPERRDEAAKAAAPYCHARRGVSTPIDVPGAGNCITSISIISVPRGGQFDSASGRIIWPDGTLTDPPLPFQPLLPMPSLELSDQTAPAAIEPTPEPLPVEPVADDPKVVPLRRPNEN